MIKYLLLIIINYILIVNTYASPTNDTIFKSYNLRDFCLDITDETNRKNFDFLLSRIDFNSFEQGFFEKTVSSFINFDHANQTTSNKNSEISELEQQLTQSMNLNDSVLATYDLETQIKLKTTFINKISINSRKTLADNLEYYAPNWKNTLFSKIDENSAYCAIIGDAFSNKNFIPYALLLTLEIKDRKFIISDINDANFFTTLKERYQYYTPEFFNLSLAETYNINDYQNSPLYRFLLSIKTQNLKSSLSAYKYLSDEQKKNPIIMQALINVISTESETYNENIKIISENLNSNTPSYILLNAYIEHSKFNEANQIIKILNSSFGYHPSHSFYNLILDELQKNDLDFKNLIYAIDADDGYEMTYWQILNNFVQLENYDDCIIVLNILKNRFNADFNSSTFLKNSTYKSLIKSKSFQQWKANIP